MVLDIVRQDGSTPVDRNTMDPCAANTTWLVCRFRHFTGFIAGCRAMGRAGIDNCSGPDINMGLLSPGDERKLTGKRVAVCSATTWRPDDSPGCSDVR